MVLCAVSQTTFFAVCYSGRLDRTLDRIRISDACVTYSRKIAVTYASIAWTMVLLDGAFTFYSLFFFGGYYMDIMLAPITTHVNLSDLLVPRIVLFFCLWYFHAAWIFPHAMSFMLATVFRHQYQVLSRDIDDILAEGDERRMSDSDVETLRERHQKISMSVNETDNFLMFHNAGAFCFQLFDAVLILYDLIFFHDTDDVVVFVMRVFCIFGVLSPANFSMELTRLESRSSMKIRNRTGVSTDPW